MLQQYACGNNHKVKRISQKKKKRQGGKKSIVESEELGRLCHKFMPNKLKAQWTQILT